MVGIQFEIRTSQKLGIRNGGILLEPISKMWIRVQGKMRGASEVVYPSIREYTIVCEHFEPPRNAALGNLDAF